MGSQSHSHVFCLLALMPLLLPFWAGPGCPGQSSFGKVEWETASQGIWGAQIPPV